MRIAMDPDAPPALGWARFHSQSEESGELSSFRSKPHHPAPDGTRVEGRSVPPVLGVTSR
jgi:hypothetical protein